MTDYVRIREQLVRSVRRACPRSLADRGDDIVQNAMIRVLEAQKKGELNEAPPASYLWKVAYTATVDEIRRVRRRREAALESASADEGHGPVDDTSRQEQSMWELGRTVRQCLARLRERRRLVVGLHLLGYGLSEAAERTGWSANRVRNLLYRGLADLRRCLASKGVSP